VRLACTACENACVAFAAAPVPRTCLRLCAFTCINGCRGPAEWRGFSFCAWTQQLPEFPPKKYFGSLSPALIKERQEALEKYMKHLVSDKKVLQCKELRQFLETPDTTDPEKHKEYDFGRR